jgi:hypothetical protein
MSPRWYRSSCYILCLGLALTLLGCGVSSNQSGAGKSLPPVPKKTPSPNPQLPTRGCTQAQPPADLGTPAVVLAPAAQPVTATVKMGDIIQLRFNPAYAWSAEDLGSLSVIDPAGYFDAVANACTWNLRATTAGTQRIQFTGDPVSSPTATVASRSLVANFVIDVAS